MSVAVHINLSHRQHPINWLTESCSTLCNGEQMRQCSVWVGMLNIMIFQWDILLTFNVLMTCNLMFMQSATFGRQQLHTYWGALSLVSVVLDDTVQDVHHQFTCVSVSSVHCNRTARAVCQCPSSLTGVNDWMTVNNEWERIWKEAVVAECKVHCQDVRTRCLPVTSRKIYHVSQRGLSVMLPIVSLRTAPRRQWSVRCLSYARYLRSKAADCWDRGFEARWGQGCLSLVFVVCCARADHSCRGVQLGVSA